MCVCNIFFFGNIVFNSILFNFFFFFWLEFKNVSIFAIHLTAVGNFGMYIFARGWNIGCSWLFLAMDFFFFLRDYVNYQTFSIKVWISRF